MLGLAAALLVAASPSSRLTMAVSLHAVGPTEATLLFETADPVVAAVHYEVGKAKVSRTARDAAPATLHRITLTDLRPGEPVSYQLEGVEPVSSGRFTAAPALGSPGRVRFAVVGDSRDHAIWAGISQAVAQAQPDFVLVTGDSITGRSADDARDWRDYYNAAAPLFASVPVYAVPGNHDVGDAFARYNPDPGGGGPYAFAWGPLAVVGLDSNHPDARADWLPPTLTALSGGPLFVFQHHPLYSCGIHGGSARVREAWGDLFAHAHVTIDFAGHDHDLIDWGVVDGVRYTVSGGGGTVLYPLVGCHCPFALSSYGFVIVEVERGQVTERFYDALGALLFSDGPFAAASASLETKRAAAALAR